MAARSNEQTSPITWAEIRDGYADLRLLADQLRELGDAESLEGARQIEEAADFWQPLAGQLATSREGTMAWDLAAGTTWTPPNITLPRSGRVHAVCTFQDSGILARNLMPRCGVGAGQPGRRIPTAEPVNCPDCLRMATP